MRVLFLNLPSPPGVNVARDFLGYGVATPSKRFRYGHDGHVVPPIFEAYSAALLRMEGFDVEILDGQVRDLDVDPLLHEVANIQPDVVVSRISLPSFRQDLGLLAKVRETVPNVLLVGWGTLCTVKPREALSCGPLDVAIRGELELSILKLMKQLRAGKPLDGVEGISAKQHDRILVNPPHPPIKDLDVLPTPAYDLLDMGRYLIKEERFFPEGGGGRLTRFFSIYSSRGCPFNCMYCPYSLGFGSLWRGMSPRRTVDEIERLVEEYGVQGIWFRDQVFSMDIPRAMKICDELIRRRLEVRWTCETRADRLSRTLVRKMKEAGCVWINLGVETGDPKLLRRVGKRGGSLKTIEKAFKITREVGIRRRAFILIGLPGETWQSIKRTRRFIEKISPDAITVDIVTPYPGTQLYEMAKRHGWLVTEDWSQYTTVDPVMSYENFTAEEMKMARRYLLDRGRIEEKVQRIISALKGGRFGDAMAEIRTVFLEPSESLWRLYNLVRCRLRGL